VHRECDIRSTPGQRYTESATNIFNIRKDIIGLLVTSVIVIGGAVVWECYLESKTDFPPILRMSVISRHRGRLGIMLFVTVSVCLRVCQETITVELTPPVVPSDGLV
jgi:hypothetical protein